MALSLEGALLDAGAGEVVICASVGAAMAELERAKPDAIILDAHLTDRSDGWALAELVSLLGPKTPRIAFATAAPEEIPANVKELGPVFEKPYDPAQLADVVLNQKKIGLIARLRGAFG